MLQTLFGLKGRLTRTGFWEVLVSVLLLDVAAGVSAITAFEQAFPGGAVNAASATYEVVRWGLLAVVALSIWAIAAAHAKRAHDLGHGAVILLWVLVPILGWLYLLFELGFKPGQEFRNRFGPQPLGHHDSHSAGEREVRFASNHDHHGHGQGEAESPPQAHLDWTGAATEESAEAAADQGGDYDAGEALMAASEHPGPEPEPASDPTSSVEQVSAYAVPMIHDAPPSAAAVEIKAAHDDLSAAMGDIRAADQHIAPPPPPVRGSGG